MKATVLDEPELVFGSHAGHVDPRHGVSDYGPVDQGDPTAPDPLRVGMVGTAGDLDGLTRWLHDCSSGVPGRSDTHLTSLFRDFPGVGPDQTYRTELVTSGATRRTVSSRALGRATDQSTGLATEECVELYREQIEDLNESNRADVILVARPDDLHDDRQSAQPEGSDDVVADPFDANFHDLLKARCLKGTPLQLIRSATWDPARKALLPEGKRQQDPATRAWNLFTALYYKAGGTPWRLARTDTDLRSLYIGISFFRTTDRAEVHTSVAQVFDERGAGVVVRGGPAARHKSDRQPHLTRSDAKELLLDAVRSYRLQHKHAPARVVIHKTSQHDDNEISGFDDAAGELALDELDLLWISDKAERTRLFRTGTNPVLRCTFLGLDDRQFLLYTRGSIGFYRVYPGMYIPRPIGMRLARHGPDPMTLALEILALSKLNWNQSQMDNRLPITVGASRKVSNILKHLGGDYGAVARYAHFM